ncbi:TonB-dependent receptor, partial [Acinetobacter baumannii]
LAEIHPSDGQFHSELQSEYGWNYELGLKGNVWNRKLSFDIAAYCFNLQNAIVRRNNTVGQEYFVNAGNIVEKGFETWAL